MGRLCGSGSINFLVVDVKSEVLMPGLGKWWAGGCTKIKQGWHSCGAAPCGSCLYCVHLWKERNKRVCVCGVCMTLIDTKHSLWSSCIYHHCCLNHLVRRWINHIKSSPSLLFENLVAEQNMRGVSTEHFHHCIYHHGCLNI